MSPRALAVLERLVGVLSIVFFLVAAVGIVALLAGGERLP